MTSKEFELIKDMLERQKSYDEEVSKKHCFRNRKEN